MSKRRLLACLLTLSLFLSNLNIGLITPGYAENILFTQESSEMQEGGSVTIPTAQPEPSPEVFLYGENASYSVQVYGGVLAAGAELAVQLETRLAKDPWTAVQKPGTQGEEFRLTLTLEENGEAQAVFPLTGLPSGREYRVRVFSGQAMDGQSLPYTAAYTDQHPREDSFVTLITLDVKEAEPAATTAPAEPAVSETPAAELTATPAPAEPSASETPAAELTATPAPVEPSVSETPAAEPTATPAPSEPAVSETPAPQDDATPAPSQPADSEAYSQAPSFKAEATATPESEMLQVGMASLDIPQDSPYMLSGLPFALFAATTDNYQLTLNLALNGASVPLPIVFSLTKDDSGVITDCTLGTPPSGATVSRTAGGGQAVLTVTPDTGSGAPTLTYTIIIDSNDQYTISASDAVKSAYDLIGLTSSGTFVNKTASAALTAMELTEYIVSVNWNDNRVETNRHPDFRLLADGNDISASPVITNSSYNLTKYTYKLPKYNGLGQMISYSFSKPALEESLKDYYLLEYDASNSLVTCTLKTSLVINKQWYDASTKADTRPSQANWLSYITLHRQSRKSGASASAIIMNPVVEDTADADRWKLTVKDLPAYDPEGYPYDYWIEESAVPVKDPSKDLGVYTPTVENVGIYGDKTAPGTVYEGGTLISTITDKIGFEFTKEWVDGNVQAGRPGVKFYLYRFPENSGLGYDTLAPVKGFDSYTLLAKSATSNLIVYAADEKLPRYDTLGNEYVYYVREVMESQGDYKIEIDNPAGSDTTKYILPGSTVTNVLKADIPIPFTKVWKAKAVQSMRGGVAMVLERRLASAGDTAPWAEAGTTTLTGFRAEAMTMTGQFGSQPKYDENGALYEYRVRETGATIDANETGWENSVSAGNTFSSGGYSFQVTQPADGSNTVINQLVGTTKLKVKKDWVPDLDDGKSAAITVQILQNGQNNWNADAVTFPAEVSHAPGTTSFTISGQGDLEALFDNLPCYDNEGREYAYTIQETGFSGAEGYSFADILYSLDSSNVKTGTIVNTKDGEGGLRFDAEKAWLDDGDLLTRVPVTMGLFYKSDMTLLKTFVLTADDMWQGRIGYDPVPDGRSTNYDDYVIREISSSGLTIEGDYNGYLASGSGFARSSFHRYQVSTAVSSSNRYTISNLRIGKLKITVNKTWQVNDLEALPLAATFKLYANGVEKGTRQLSMSINDAIVFDDLDKYDGAGAIISYIVREEALEGLSASATPFAGGSIDLGNGEFILSSAAPGTYAYGATLDDPDSMAHTFTNSLGGSGEITINKVWRDLGTGVPTRPDIKLLLYRHTGSSPAVGDNELVAETRLWNTRSEENNWFWTCSFGSYPKFDGHGNRYHYYVQEVILQKSDYAASYFGSIDGTATQPVPSGKTTKETFVKQSGEGGTYAYASFDSGKTGTIINTLRGFQDVEQKKLWVNLPAWFNLTDLPTVKFKLYRYTSDISNAETVLKEGDPWIETLAGGMSKALFKDLPIYDEYGSRYYYYVEELNESGAPLLLTGYYAPKNNIVTGSVTNTYNLEVPYVEISVKKIWAFPGKQADQLKYPDTVFELHQTWSKGSTSRDAVINTMTLSGGDIASLPTDNSIQDKFVKDASGNALLHYAPDGQAYGYYVTEKPLSGYTVDTEKAYAGGWAGITKPDDDNLAGTATLTNTYTPEDWATITATKTWDDRNNAFNTRPEINSAGVTFTLWRKTGSASSEEQVPATTAWSVKSGSSNVWECSFTPLSPATAFPKYSTQGKAYTYYVTEVLGSPFHTHYRLSAGENTLNITNSLKTVNVQAKKIWQGLEGSTPVTLSEADLRHLYSLGVMPHSAAFGVSYSDDGGANWSEYTGASTAMTVLWENLLTASVHGDYITVATGLPQYSPGSNEERKYKVDEYVIMKSGDTPSSPTPAQFDVNYSLTGNTQTTIVNTLEVRKLFFVKNWVDENNRDGVRPGSIAYTVTRQDGSESTTTTVTLTASTTSTDPKKSDVSDPYYEEHKAAENRWMAELIVPAGGTYSVAEAAPGSGYVRDASKDITGEDDASTPQINWWSFTNARDKKLISVKATKTWSIEGKWAAITRPGSVTFDLEYRPSGSNTWINLYSANRAAVPDTNIPVGAGTRIAITPSGDDWSLAFAQWEHLPAYVKKDQSSDTTAACQYRVVESSNPVGYTAASSATVTGTTLTTENPVTVTNTLQTVSLTVTKNWANDTGDLYGTRPDTVGLTLMLGDDPVRVDAVGDVIPPDTAAGTDSLYPFPGWTKNANNTWTCTYTGLPVYSSSGTALTYRVMEDTVAGYTATDLTVTATSLAPGGNLTAGLTNTLETVYFSGSKTWVNDSSYVSLARPDSVTLKLYADNVVVSVKDGSAPLQPTWVKNPGNIWTYTYYDLPKYKKGSSTEEVTYTIEEAPPAGYTASPAGAIAGSKDAGTGNVTTVNFTNTLIPVTITGTKEWSDQSDAYGTRPANLSLTLKADGSAVSPQPSPQWDNQSTGTWTYTYSGLPKCDKTGKVITYSVTEAAVTGYTAHPASTMLGSWDAASQKIIVPAITNTLQTVDLTGRKIWADQSDAYGMRPDSITLTLYADGSPITPATGALSFSGMDTDTWTYTFQTLPKYRADGTTPINYSVQETLDAPFSGAYVTAPAGGTVSSSLDNGRLVAANLTNTLQTVSLTGTKAWADQSNAYGTRPSSIELTLYADGDVFTPAMGALSWSGQSSGDTWTYTFSGLPKYAYKNGTAYQIMYAVKEGTTNGYISDAATSVSAAWDSDKGKFVVPVITNTLQTVDLTGRKVWTDHANIHGMRPADITLTLYADGSPITPASSALFWSGKDTDTWTYTFQNLPKYQTDGTTPISYSVQETLAAPFSDAYASTPASGAVSSSLDNGQLVAADLENTLQMISLTGKKVWADQSNAYGTRPGSIDLTLYADGTLTPATLSWSGTDTDTWTYTFSGLPKYAYKSGAVSLITYTVKEGAVKGYTSDAAAPVSAIWDNEMGMLAAPAITNTLSTVSIAGKKTWNDDGDRYGKRPDGITLTVLADGIALLHQPSIQWTKIDNEWTYITEGLPKYKKDMLDPVTYTVQETAVAGYTPKTGTTAAGTVDLSGNVTNADFTNTLITVSVSGIKTWADVTDHYGTRPASISLTLYAGSNPVVPQPDPIWNKPAGANAWTYEYTGLPRYEKGTATPIVYSVLETAVADYTPSAIGTVTGNVDGGSGNVTGIHLTNTLKTVSVSGTKTWVDNTDYYSTRPASISLTLYAGGNPVSPQPDPQWSKPAGNAWTYEYTGLPRYEKGTATPIVYSVRETAVAADYTPSVTGAVTGMVDGVSGHVTKADFINTLATITISGKKTWLDDNDRYGTRPDSILLTVLTDGTALSPQPNVSWVKNGGEWVYTITGLPKYQTGTTTPMIYSVQETASAGYLPSSDTTVSGTLDAGGNVINANFENTLVTVSLSGTKSWLDESNKYGTRPSSITLTVQSGNAALSPQPEPLWNKAAGADHWTYEYKGLPKYQKGTLTPVKYYVSETPAKGYTPGTLAPVAGTLDSDGNLTDADFTNSLITISVSGTKIWFDQSNRFGTRPGSIILTLLSNGEPVTPQPEPVWNKTTMADAWTYAFTGLPRFKAGTDEPLIYTVRETPVSGYQPVKDQAGTAGASGNILISDLANTLSRRLMIDNITVNPTSTSTDVGGFVAVGGAPDSQRDLTPYQEDGTAVQWRAEENWQHSAKITVRYLEHGKDPQSGWNSVTVPTSDLSALKSIPYFANASLTVNGGTVILRLADDPGDMPYFTEVMVDFYPTLAVENTTRKDAGGKVSIQTASVSADGRYPSVTAYGEAMNGYAIDMRSLQLSPPHGVSGTVPENTSSVPIKPDANGRFSTAITVMLAGEEKQITVTGMVEVLKRNDEHNPVKIAVTLDELPVSLDIGIPFARAGSIPVTGDPIPWVVAAFVLSGLAMILFRRKKAKSGPDKK